MSQSAIAPRKREAWRFVSRGGSEARERAPDLVLEGSGGPERVRRLSRRCGPGASHLGTYWERGAHGLAERRLRAAAEGLPRRGRRRTPLVGGPRPRPGGGRRA